MDKFWDGLFGAIPWVVVGGIMFWVASCVEQYEANREFNKKTFMEDCVNDGYKQHKCLLLWHRADEGYLN